jgi:hypothetical protein
MTLLHTLHARVKSGMGKNALPGTPGPQCPPDLLEARGDSRQRLRRGSHPELAGVQGARGTGRHRQNVTPARCTQRRCASGVVH